jgi:hypothetical protein
MDLTSTRMEHRVIQVDLSSSDETSFAICEVAYDDKGRMI